MYGENNLSVNKKAILKFQYRFTGNFYFS